MWSKLLALLNKEARKRVGKKADPTLLVIDSQSVKTGRMTGNDTKGFDGGKKVRGRKRHMVVDTQGLLVDLTVTPANMHDTKGGARVISRIARRRKLKTVKTVLADKGYQGANFAGCVKQKLGAVVRIGENLAMKVKKFVPAKKRWVVERSFAWIGNYYRLSIDRERKLAVSASLVRIVFIRLLLMRLWPG